MIHKCGWVFSVCLPFSYRSLHAIWHQRLSLRCLAKTVVVECVSDYAGVCVCCFADSAWTFQAKTRRHTSWVEQACFQILPSLTTWPPSNLVFFVSVYLCVCVPCMCMLLCRLRLNGSSKKEATTISGEWSKLASTGYLYWFQTNFVIRVDPTVGVTRLNLQGCVRVCVCVLVMFA